MNRRDFTAALAVAMASTAMPLWAQTAEAPVLPVVPDMFLGKADAKVVLTEYASYTCPHCATFHQQVFKDLKRDYIDTGKIKFVYREVFFDRYGLWAAMVARCGGDLRYFGIQEILYSTQQEWAASDDPATVVENLRRVGRTAGLENDALDACLNDAAMAQAMVNKYQEDTKADNITSTPSFMLNGVQHSNMNYADLKALLDAELAK
ncbi:Protein-disulfide isomerase [Pseudorhodobacter antarcticus]|jgi:protein-disulfide isomerase|uniref:Protein-disulfide isomerase n=1 Tax=Pseudorhodobacter antarcticus TaxID=1077947 RepID=A0A1H8IPJ8_9RHOB|nr:DsbA family protein [Pseudorhodobacter antarcticus]SEN70613.1 Protein-disulfide isomerase [Pseudorhodobacter antarcticus]